MKIFLLNTITFILIIKCIDCIPLGFGFGNSGSQSDSKEMSVLEYNPSYSTNAHRQRQIAKQRGIKPIVDTIQEEEKYGNDGGFIRKGANALIRLTEGTSAAISNNIGSRPTQKTYNLLAPFDPFFTNIGVKIAGL